MPKQRRAEAVEEEDEEFDSDIELDADAVVEDDEEMDLSEGEEDDDEEEPDSEGDDDLPAPKRQRRDAPEGEDDDKEEDDGPLPDVGLVGGAVLNPADALLLMEVKELLAEYAVDRHSEASWISTVVPALKAFLVSLKPAELKADALCPGYSRAVGSGAEQGVLKFSAPDLVEIIGPVEYGSGVRGSVGKKETVLVDLMVRLPPTCLWEKDHLNHRWHVKKMIFLTHVLRQLAAHAPLQRHVDLATSGLSFLDGDLRRPVLSLAIRRPGGNAPLTTLRLLPCAPCTALTPARLSPEKNCLRSHVAADDAAAQLPTPFYNQSVLADVLLDRLEAQCRVALGAALSLGDGVRLLKLWFRAQGLTGPGSLGGCRLLPELLVAHLTACLRIIPSMNPVQILRAALQLLADKPAWAAGILASCTAAAFPAIKDGVPASPPRTAFSKTYPVTFLDATGWVNLTAAVQLGELQRTQGRAARALQLLSSASEDTFDALFVPPPGGPAAVWAQADYSYRVRLPREAVGMQLAGAQQVSLGDACLARDLPPWTELLHSATRTLRKALTDRTRAIVLESSALSVLTRTLDAAVLIKSGSLQSLTPLPADLDPALLTANLAIDPEHAFRAADIGPSPEDKAAAAAFKAFWGPKAELRRFKDGRVAESVVWEVRPSERHHIPDLVVAYALTRHLPSGAAVKGAASLLDAVIHSAAAATTDATAENEADLQAFFQLDNALLTLSKQIRALEGLPLQVQSVQALGAAARKTLVFPPRAHALAGAPNHRQMLADPETPVPRVVTPCEVVVTLEGTGKWPEDPEAYYKMKAALALQLATKLREEHGYEALPSEDAVDLLVSGFVCRLLLQVDRDALVQQVIAIRKRSAATLAEQKGVAAIPADELPFHLRTPDESLYSPLRKLSRTGIPDLSWMHGAVAAVGGMFAAFAPTVRLFKRWASAAHLSNHLSEEALELIAAHVFHAPGCLDAPASRHAGLARCLTFLATWPFDKRPLFLDLPAATLSEAQRREALRTYNARKEAGEAVPALYLVCTHDLESRLWSAHRPSKIALQRAQAAAAAALELLRGAVLVGRKGGSVDAVFDGVRPLLACDVVFSLRREALPYADRLGSGSAASTADGQKAWFGFKSGGMPVEPRAAARAVLRHIPRALLASRGPQRLRSELLVGFDPLRILAERLEARLGAFAVPWVDGDLGTHVGLTFVKKAFAPAPLKPAWAHVCGPADDEAEEAAAPRVVPDMEALLDEAVAAGEGLIEAVFARAAAAGDGAADDS